MTHDDIRQRQRTLLARLLALLQTDQQVLGVAAIGPHARGEEDAFSDLDLKCYLRDEARTGRERLHQQVAALAPTLAVLYLYDAHGLYLYADGTRLDLDYLGPDSIDSEQPTARILLDPDGVLVPTSAARSTLPTRPMRHTGSRAIPRTSPGSCGCFAKPTAGRSAARKAATAPSINSWGRWTRCIKCVVRSWRCACGPWAPMSI